MNIDWIIGDATRMVWLTFRLIGLFMMLPALSHYVLPMRIKTSLIFILSGVLCLLPIATPAQEIMILNSIGDVIKEILLGAMIGLIFQMIFQVFLVAAQIISQQSGLQFSSMVSPNLGSGVSVISQLYILMACLLFFSLNGHLMIFNLIIKSYSTISIGGNYSLKEWLVAIINYSAIMINCAVLIVLPIILSMMVLNFSLAVMSRSFPQANLISIGFPLLIMFGLFIIYVTLGTVSELMINVFESGISFFYQVGIS